MKKKLHQHLFNIGLGFLACIVLIFSFIRESQKQVNLNLGASNVPPHTRVVVEKPVNVPRHSDYVLPTPGILPTNPLYVIKMVRDRVSLIITTNPDQRAIRLLHLADKRIATAQTLAINGYQNQAIEVATKGENYLFRAINESPKVSVNKKAQWYDTLKQAILKHEEVIEEMQQVVDDSGKKQTQKLHQNLDQYRHLLVSLSNEPFGYPRPEDNLLTPTPPASPSDIPTIVPYM